MRTSSVSGVCPIETFDDPDLRCLARRRSAVFSVKREASKTYGNAVSILLADTLSFGLALLKRMLVLELGTHGDDVDEVLSRSAGEAGPGMISAVSCFCRVCSGEIVDEEAKVRRLMLRR